MRRCAASEGLSAFRNIGKVYGDIARISHGLLEGEFVYLLVKVCNFRIEMSGMRIRGKASWMSQHIFRRGQARPASRSLVADYLAASNFTGYHQSGLWISDPRFDGILTRKPWSGRVVGLSDVLRYWDVSTWFEERLMCTGNSELTSRREYLIQAEDNISSYISTKIYY